MIILDVESTGPDPVLNRILTIALTKLSANAAPARIHYLFNGGGQIMTPETIAIHGITQEVAAAHPAFSSAYAHDMLAFIHGCDMGGFNLMNFDVQILWEEFYRVGITWDLAGINFVDVFGIFRKKEPRDLEAAVKFYCGREHVGAHEAACDVQATTDVLHAQLARYPDLGAMTIEQLAEYSTLDRDGNRKLDLAGVVVRGKDGVARYTHKRVRGVAVEEDPGYAHWIISHDFPQETKMVLRGLLAEVARKESERGQEQLF